MISRRGSMRRCRRTRLRVRMTKRMRLLVSGGVVAVVLFGLGLAVFGLPNDLGDDAVMLESHPEANVPVSVVLSSDARRMVVEVDWVNGLDAFTFADRSTIRVMAGGEEVELTVSEDTRPDVQRLVMRFTAAEATLLLAAAASGDAVVAVTQQFDGDNDSLYELNFVTVLRIPAPLSVASGDESPWVSFLLLSVCSGR